MDVTTTQRKQLKTWYLDNHRKLPWRETKDPYAIWLSEVMLQQTTVKAVIPYYEKFLKRFPTAQKLASADISEVYEYWAGLGYYSRARNLHKAAIFIAKNNFPRTYETLLELPGFGPYTARAVAAFAFNQNVGVVDGNVIRFLCRLFNLKISWWENKQRPLLQDLADQFVKNEDASVINQALIELGATICTSSSPACLVCPLRTSCQSYSKKTQSQVPLKKPRKKKEVWIWYADIYHDKQNRLALIQNEYAPFLKGQFIFPGKVANSVKAPKIYDYKHNITHHEIYVRVQEKVFDKANSQYQSLRNKLQWHAKKDLKKITPVSLIEKALKFLT